MASKILRALTALDLEERILNSAALIGLIGVLLPWFSDERVGGDPLTYSGFSFYTSFLGVATFCLLAFIVSVTAVPILGGPVFIRKRHQEILRFIAASQSTVLLLASLSVLTKVTFEMPRVNVRFGMYVSLIGAMVTTLYTFLKWQDQRKNDLSELFHHPEDLSKPMEVRESRLPPPPAPIAPPPLEPEEHHLVGSRL